jgi:hypothetical protein
MLPAVPTAMRRTPPPLVEPWTAPTLSPGPPPPMAAKHTQCDNQTMTGLQTRSGTWFMHGSMPLKGQPRC